ncbi:MAG: hypothetical protein OXD50_06825 [Chloroflexi bacterium]|nr:hypothetical protein [Chloroflexota bacterium]
MTRPPYSSRPSLDPADRPEETNGAQLDVADLRTAAPDGKNSETAEPQLTAKGAPVLLARLRRGQRLIG